MANVVYKINDGMEITLNKETVEKCCAGGKKITDEAFTQFAALCKQHKLNPFTREAYILVVGENRFNIMVGKDGYFKMADSNPNYDGMQDGIVIEDKNGNIQHLEGCFVPPGCKLLAGWARAYSKERKYPKYAVCSMDEYKGSEKSLWGTKPATMINKVAKCLALRDLFPQTYNGTYDESEINNISEQQNVTTSANVETANSESKKIEEQVKTKAEEPIAKSTAVKKTNSSESKVTVMPLIDALSCTTKTKSGKETTFEKMLDSCKDEDTAKNLTKYLYDQVVAKTEIAEPCLVIYRAIMSKEYKFKNVKA